MTRSKRYKAVAEKIDIAKAYGLEEALTLAKETATTKFDGSVELHFKLGIDVSKADQNVRALAKLPHPIGTTKRLAVFTDKPADAEKAKAAGATLAGGDDLVKEIETTKKLNFDVAVATPAMMKVIGRIAKILGPKGLMPSPKNGTVVTDVVKAVADLQGGQVAFKNDATGNIHQVIGKVSYDLKTLQENAAALIDALKKAKPTESKGTFLKSATVTTTMGPGIKLAV